ncbi:hypothetical protein B6N60_02216 [Richelia sinica FACHB-800]|uniref:Uncharacterized protein n=1 Tax=Richelia sinica FACHB-800 TaxID=1357546 RepID=A0A975T787_9NOST|nr:hypothetical protein B6N60_02216 [Richelia sinica FACHB-800]
MGIEEDEETLGRMILKIFLNSAKKLTVAFRGGEMK